jgi:hypothetical protein
MTADPVDDFECERSTGGGEWGSFLRAEPRDPGEFYLAIRALMASRRTDEAAGVASRATSLYQEDPVLRAALSWVTAVRRGRVRRAELAAATDSLKRRETGFTRAVLTRMLLIDGGRSKIETIKEPGDIDGRDRFHPFEVETEALVELVRRHPEAAIDRVEMIRDLDFPSTFTQAHTMMLAMVAVSNRPGARSWYLERQLLSGSRAYGWVPGAWKVRRILMMPSVAAWILAVATGWWWLAVVATMLTVPSVLLMNHVLASAAVRRIGYEGLAALWVLFGLGVYVRFVFGLA